MQIFVNQNGEHAFGRKLLRHGHILNKYGIQNESTLHLMPTTTLKPPPMECRRRGLLPTPDLR